MSSQHANYFAQCDNLCNNIKQNRSIRNIANVNMQLADCRSFAKLTCNWMLHRPSMFTSVLNTLRCISSPLVLTCNCPTCGLCNFCQNVTCNCQFFGKHVTASIFVTCNCQFYAWCQFSNMELPNTVKTFAWCSTVFSSSSIHILRQHMYTSYCSSSFKCLSICSASQAQRNNIR